MRRFAFTLVEILISLAIIGCIGAFMIPAMHNMTPDQNKALYLKTYNELSQAIQSLVNDSRIYPPCQEVQDEEGNITENCPERFRTYPFTNNAQGTFTDGVVVSGNTKFRDALAHSFGIDISTINNDNTFALPNGVNITVEPTEIGIVAGRGRPSWRNEITLNINGTAFTLHVAADGQIYFGDIQGLAYKQTETDRNAPSNPEGSWTLYTNGNNFASCFQMPRDDANCKNFEKNN